MEMDCSLLLEFANFLIGLVVGFLVREFLEFFSKK